MLIMSNMLSIGYILRIPDIADTQRILAIADIAYMLRTLKADNDHDDKTTLTLKRKTHDRLDRYKAKLIGKAEKSRMSFDDAVNHLLDLADSEESKK